MDGVYAGAFAGAVTTVMMHPLDLVKVRLQVGRGTSFTEVMKGLYYERWANAYRGLTPNLIGNICGWGAYFGCYDMMQRIAFGPQSDLPRNSSVFLGCAFAAGIISQALTNPIWVVKTRILGSTQNDRNASPYILRNLQQIYLHSGIQGFWRGFLPGTLGTVQSSLYFAIYGPMKPWLKEHTGMPDTAVYFVSSAVAKSIAATVMYPHQVIRARMQFSEMTLTTAIRDVWCQEHWRGFYRGLSANLARVVPAMAITLLSYESAKEWLVFQTSKMQI